MPVLVTEDGNWWDGFVSIMCTRSALKSHVKIVLGFILKKRLDTVDFEDHGLNNSFYDSSFGIIS